MSFFINLGYTFKHAIGVDADGVVIPASVMPIHQLMRRRFTRDRKMFARRLFDPQLYLAGMDAAASPEHCTNLASYLWFGVSGLPRFSSSSMSASDWKVRARRKIRRVWRRDPPESEQTIRDGIDAALDLQSYLGCEIAILPSPLTSDPATDYAAELLWLDIGLEVSRAKRTGPILATIALSDLCLRHLQPAKNRLLEMIADAVSAREVSGVYLVLEQASEPDDARQCADSRTLGSLLRLTSLLSMDCGLRVVVNFMGPFGMVCQAAGADTWASGWYKSLYRIRLADRLGGGYAYPLYWSHPSALDIHLRSDLDSITAAGLLDAVADETPASAGLLGALRSDHQVSSVPRWTYRPGNIQSAEDHYLESAMAAEEALQKSDEQSINWVAAWLSGANERSPAIAEALGETAKTRMSHVAAWLEAFETFRGSQGP